jgi:hypothetical protein
MRALQNSPNQKASNCGQKRFEFEAKKKEDTNLIEADKKRLFGVRNFV